MAFFRTGGGGGIPAALKSAMNAVLNKKFGTAQTYEPNEWPDDVNLLGALEEKTVSAAPIASFSDGADDVPMSSVVAHIAPTLTGTNAVNMVKAGKNFYPISVGADRFTNNGGATHSNDNGILVIVASTGNASGVYINTSDTLCEARNVLKWFYDNEYPKTISFDVVASADNISFRITSGSNTLVTIGTTPTRVSHVSTGNNLSLYAVNNSATIRISNLQIEYGSTATEYEQYQENAYTADLGRTIYGGQADIVNGIGTDENGDDFTFDGQEIPSFLGVNNLWNDAGNTAIVYRSSGTETIIMPTLISKTITENGTYNAADDDADGFDQVTIDVEGEEMNYSTTEHAAGTWIDGSVIYERTFELSAQLTVSSSTWTSSGIAGDGINKIIGVELFGVSNYQGGGLANIQNNVIMLQTTRNSDAYVKEFSLRYLKS